MICHSSYSREILRGDCGILRFMFMVGLSLLKGPGRHCQKSTLEVVVPSVAYLTIIFLNNDIVRGDLEPNSHLHRDGDFG